MSKRELLRWLLYIVQWLGFLSFVFLVAVFSLTGAMLEVPDAAYEITGGGFVEKYGMRPVLLILFVVACAVDAICLVLARFPKFFRYPVMANVRNIEIQYLLAKMMLAIIQCVATAYFTILMMEIYEMEIRLKSPSFVALSLAASALIGLDICVYLALARKKPLIFWAVTGIAGIMSRKYIVWNKDGYPYRTRAGGSILCIRERE